MLIIMIKSKSLMLDDLDIVLLKIFVWHVYIRIITNLESDFMNTFLNSLHVSKPKLYSDFKPLEFDLPI